MCVCVCVERLPITVISVYNDETKRGQIRMISVIVTYLHLDSRFFMQQGHVNTPVAAVKRKGGGEKKK